MTSLDELLEKILRAIYGGWFTDGLAQEQAQFEAVRRQLARQLATLTPDDRSPDDVKSAESQIRAFLEDISLLPTVNQLADADLLRARNLQSERLVRLTNLSAQRIETLCAWLEAANPPLFLLKQLPYHDHTPRQLVGGSGTEQPANTLIETLSNALKALHAGWETLPEPSRSQVHKVLLQLNKAIATAPNGASVVAKESVIALLDDVAAIPDVLPLVYAALLAGKTDARSNVRSRGITRGGQMSNQVEVSKSLTDLLMAPGATADAPSAQIDFLVKVTFPQQPSSGRPHALTVELVRQRDPAFDVQRVRYLETVRLPRSALADGLPLQVVLLTQAFVETTGDQTRTLLVNATGTVTPAVFLLQTPAEQGSARIGVRLEQTLTTAEFETRITVARGAFESLPAAAGGWVEAEEAVAYQSDVDFPAQVRPRTDHALIVRLARLLEEKEAGLADATLQFSSTEDAKLVEVILTAPGFDEATQCTRRTMRVFRDRNSQPAVFWLNAHPDLGKTPLTVDFYHAGRMLGSVTYESEITPDVLDAAARAPRSSAINQLSAPPANPPAPADLTLRITKNDQTNTLHFALHSSNSALGYDQRDMGQITLNAAPRRFLTDTFDQLSRLARQGVRNVDVLSEADTAVEENELVRIGENLFEKLFPKPLRDEYWRLKELREAGEIRSLLIISDEPWIPWELVKPYQYDEASGQDLTDDFLAVAFDLCRWLAGRGPLADLKVTAASVVIPELDLAYVQQEKRYFEELQARGLQMAAPLRSRDEVLNAVRDGSFQVLHLAAHGNFNPDKADQSPLVLQNRQELWPSDLSGSQVRALRRERPIVFLNACHSGQIEFSLTGLGGWAEQMISTIGVGAFIGSLWEVNDLLAAEFAIFFYDQLIAGHPLSAAFRAARSHIRQRQPANPTWLAYTLYADPNGRTEWTVRAVEE